MLAPQGYVLVTPVWGEDYASLFIEAALPTQLAPGNLPGMQARSASIYQIYTTATDEARIRQSSAFQRLSELMETQFIRIDPAAWSKHDLMSDCYRQASEHATRADSGIIFLTPDMIMSDGALMRLEVHDRSGKTAVMIVGLRLNSEDTLPFLHAKTDSAHAVTLSSRQLMAHALGHLHRITYDHIWNDGRSGGLLPSHLFWQVQGQGLLGHCFHLMPMMVRPESRNIWFSSTIDDDYLLSACPDTTRHHIVSDSDEFLICELTEASRSIGAYPRDGISVVRKFAELVTNDVHCEHVKTPIRLYADMSNEAAWQKVEAESDAIVRDVLASMQRSWWTILLHDQKIAARRLVRLQKGYRLKIKIGQPLPVPYLVARLVMGLGWSIQQLIPIYGKLLLALR
jgi:hypothetical protein